MTWTDQYAAKLVEPAAAAALVRPGDRVMCGLPEPTVFLDALGARTGLTGVECFIPAPRRGGVAIGRAMGIELQAPFLTQVLRSAAVPVELRPVTFSGWGPFTRRWAPRVRVVTVAVPLADGTVRPGSSIGADDALVRGRSGPDDVVIGVVNPSQPQIPGDAFHVDDFDHLIVLPPGEPPPDYDQRLEPEGLDAFVAAVDELIPDGATLQAGVGALAEAVMSRLGHKRNLGIHTEVFGHGLKTLMEQGAVTNARKGVFAGRSVCTIALPDTYAFVEDNPSMWLAVSDQVLAPTAIARNPDVRCVNSSIEVDLFGQSNAEMIDGTQYSGVGGQLDFLRGCALREDALAIQLLNATTRSGRSRIVPTLGPNAATGTRYDNHVVVTEHGVAWLRDATMAQRAERLIGVAHPDHRAELRQHAERVGLLRAPAAAG
ncbi:MAG: acetyl-CoA hydrolase/transferase family protein [Acidimicrobiales bacterium]